MSTITKANFDFLKQLSKNNNRDWFTENKPLYITNHEQMIGFADAVLIEMQKHDNIETISGKKSLHRIYRDVRFSKDKSPYKNHWGGGFKRATKLLRGGYYYHIEPGNTVVAGGFWGPDKEDLARIREEIAVDATELRTIINSKNFKNTFGEIWGDKLKTAPKSYPKDHADIDLLQYKQFCVVHKFTDKEALSKDFYKQVNSTFQAMRPFFNYMSEVLTTDINGAQLKKLK
ncbi:MAG: DUF2461 domain-containing protein [Flavobacteriales bacterium]|nr:DUF2461 domain-containing protein [Flavobacteriales bacterium]